MNKQPRSTCCNDLIYYNKEMKMFLCSKCHRDYQSPSVPKEKHLCTGWCKDGKHHGFSPTPNNQIIEEKAKQIQRSLEYASVGSVLEKDILIQALLEVHTSAEQGGYSRAMGEANDILRSAYQIALRKGEATNWEAFTKNLKEILEKQHKVMYLSPTDNNKEATHR